MKSLLKIYAKYICTAAVAAVLFLGIQAGLVAGVTLWMEAGGESAGSLAVRKAAEALTVDEQGIPENGEEIGQMVRQEGASFALLLDQDGSLLWSFQAPENLKRDYSAGEIGGFSKWYLDGYPVFVWNCGSRLLVLAYPKDSLWKDNITMSMRGMRAYLLLCVLEFVLLAAIALGIILWTGFRAYRRMRLMVTSVETLSGGGEVHLPERGNFKEEAASLNRTSRLLAGQREALKKRDEARAEWIRGVSHDIRTPLALIMGYGELLEERESLDPDSRSKAAIIKKQSLRIRRLIEDLNLTTKLEYEMQPLRKTRLSPAALLRQTAVQCVEGWPEREDRITLDISQEAERFRIMGDEDLLLRAFFNLMDNSFRHGGKDCLVRAGTDGEGNLVLAFSDSGPGIPEEVRRFLNEGTPAAAHVMGLKVVKQIVTAHGGTMKLGTGEEGVTVVLPAGR